MGSSSTAVTEGAGQASDQDVPVVAGAVAARVQGDLSEGRAALQVLQDENDGGAVATEQGEVDALGGRAGAEGQGTAARDVEREHVLGAPGAGELARG